MRLQLTPVRVPLSERPETMAPVQNGKHSHMEVSTESSKHENHNYHGSQQSCYWTHTQSRGSQCVKEMYVPPQPCA